MALPLSREFACAAATWSGASWPVLRPVGYRSREFACAASTWSGDSWSTLRPVGYIESCFPEKFATPRQGALVPDSRALLRIELEDGLDAAQALCGLELYSHAWLLWVFHLNGHAATRAKVAPPRCRGERVGVFATRSPFRPNPLGLSLVRLLGVEGDRISLSGIDLVNGTPVIDIKPYIPGYDAVSGLCKTPEWTNPSPLRVCFDATALDAIDQLCAHREEPGRLLDAAALRRTLQQALSADPRPLYRWRREHKQTTSLYTVTIDGLSARCRFEKIDGLSGPTDVVTVISIHHAQRKSC